MRRFVFLGPICLMAAFAVVCETTPTDVFVDPIRMGVTAHDSDADLFVETYKGENAFDLDDGEIIKISYVEGGDGHGPA